MMLKRAAFWRALARSILVQASWNFERMQNVGFCYTMLPMLQIIWTGEELKEAVRRHFQFFNTHPYFATVIIGAVIRLEQDWAEGKTSERHVNALKVGLMGSLGAVGDSLFWAALRPFCAWMAVVMILLGHPILAVVSFLVVYNIPHFMVRFGGAGVGYLSGLDIVRQLRKVDFPQIALRFKSGAIGISFAALPLLAWHFAPTADLRAGAVLLAAVLFVLTRKGIGGSRLAAGYLSATILVAWAWNTFGDSY